MLRLVDQPPPAETTCAEPHFLVGQDARGSWLAVETHNLGGGIFKSREDALRFVDFETGIGRGPSSCPTSRCNSGSEEPSWLNMTPSVMDLATSLLRCAERRRLSQQGRALTGEDIKVVALLERLADDAKNLDLHVYLIFEQMFTHKPLARRFLQRRDDLLGQLGVSYCPSDATDLVRWLTRLLTPIDERDERSPGSRRTSAVEVVPNSGGPFGLERRPFDGKRPGRLRSGASDFSAGFGIVAPLLSLWNVRAAFGELHDRAFAADHSAVPATVVSVSAVTAGRSIGSASDVVLAYRQPSGQACRVTWHTGVQSFSGVVGDTLAVVPRSSDCALPLIPSQIGDPMQTFAMAATLMAGGLASLQLWAWLFRHSPRPSSSKARATEACRGIMPRALSNSGTDMEKSPSSGL